MDLRQLEYFAAVARQRNVGRAARDLYVTQSAVSQQVRRLETELGLALLRRTGRGVEPTPAGEELLERAEAILAGVAAARTAMDEHAGVLRGGVRLAVTPGDALRLPPALADFGRAHPGVRVALRQAAPGEVVALVGAGTVDLAVAGLAAAPADERVLAAALTPEPLVLLVAAGDPLAGAGGVALWDLRERAFVLPEPGSPLRALVAGAFAGAGFSPVPLFEVGDAATVRHLVAAGLGIALAPAAWVAGPGPEVGTATLGAPSGLAQPLWLLARAAGAGPAAGLAHAHLRAALG